jgi:hypothetical protein
MVCRALAFVVIRAFAASFSIVGSEPAGQPARVPTRGTTALLTLYYGTTGR